MNEVFKYKTVMTFINPKSELTEIPMDNLSFFVINIKKNLFFNNKCAIIYK